MTAVYVPSRRAEVEAFIRLAMLALDARERLLARRVAA